MSNYIVRATITGDNHKSSHTLIVADLNEVRRIAEELVPNYKILDWEITGKIRTATKKVASA